MGELDLDRPHARGDRGSAVKIIQEWLSLGGHQLRVDGDFGPATEAAVRDFQSAAGLAADGVVGEETYAKLVAPMRAALAPIAPDGRSLGALAVEYARQHLRQHPREIGGQNRGPWVRRYMNGHEGEAWPWCAGFVCFVLRQACDALGEEMPIEASFSVDSLAASAMRHERFHAEPPPTRRGEITPGSVFLVRRTPTDWEHTGLVLAAEREVFRTIEGNTNDEGSREGYEVCARVRGYNSKDFILI